MRELELEFKGRGEVKNHLFTQQYFDGTWYIYKVIHLENSKAKPYYEVFRRIEKRANPPFALEDFVRYPSSNIFGVSAWTARSMEDALEIVKKKNAELIERQEKSDLPNPSDNNHIIQNRASEEAPATP